MPTPDESVDPTTEVDAETVEVTDEQLDAKRDEVEELRKELAQIEADRLEREQAKANSNVYEQLDGESDRLRALIAAARGTEPDFGQEAAAKRDAESEGVATVDQAADGGPLDVTDGGSAAAATGTTDPNTAVPGGTAPDTSAADKPKAGIQFNPADSAGSTTTGEGE